MKDGYSFEPKFHRDFHKQWQEFDDYFYYNPHIADFSGSMTVLKGKPMGFVEWNLTNLPELTGVAQLYFDEIQGQRLWETTDARSGSTHDCARSKKDSCLDK